MECSSSWFILAYLPDGGNIFQLLSAHKVSFLYPGPRDSRLHPCISTAHYTSRPRPRLLKNSQKQMPKDFKRIVIAEFINQCLLFVCIKSCRAIVRVFAAQHGIGVLCVYVNKGPLVRLWRAEEAASAICHLLASWHRVQPGEMSGPWLVVAVWSSSVPAQPASILISRQPAPDIYTCRELVLCPAQQANMFVQLLIIYY